MPGLLASVPAVGFLAGCRLGYIGFPSRLGEASRFEDAADVVAVVVRDLSKVARSDAESSGVDQRCGEFPPFGFVLPDTCVCSADSVQGRLDGVVVGHADEYAASCCNSGFPSPIMRHDVATHSCNRCSHQRVEMSFTKPKLIGGDQS